jgi:hypothetical protein
MSTAGDPFHSPKARLRRADQHIARLHQKIESFFKKPPYRSVVELDDDGVTQLHKFKFTDRLSPDCVHDATEALEAMRSVLDQTGYAAAVAGGKVFPKKAQFPIGDDLAGLENLVKRKVSADIPDEILALFMSFKPYKGGNDLVWAMNKLRNAGHTSLIPVAVAGGAVGFSGMIAAGPNSSVSIPGNLTLDSEKNEIIFGRVGPGGTFNYDMQFSFLVKLGEIDVVANNQAVAVLRAMSAEVKRILLATEAECRRLGFIS